MRTLNKMHKAPYIVIKRHLYKYAIHMFPRTSLVNRNGKNSYRVCNQ